MVPIFLIGAFLLASARHVRRRTTSRRVQTSALAQAEIRAGRASAATPKLLVCRGLDVAYGQTQVLFGVDFHVDEGEIVALLGTNGAGKSTLLNAISGLVEPAAGAIVFDGKDITVKPANETVAEGIVHGARRQGRVPDADRGGEPRARRLAVQQGQGARRARPPSRCSSTSRSCGSGGTRRPATCPAASSRCSRSARRSSPSRSC